VIAIAAGIASQNDQPVFTVRIAIAYAPIAMKPACPKLTMPV
jgi:hypothetical protein